MTHEEFDQLVHDVETGVGRDAPALYRRVLKLAAIGYLGLLLPLILVLLFGAAFIIPGILSPDDAFVLIGIGALVLAIGGWAASRALWIQLPPPKGREILRAESPVLFATLDDLRLRLRSAPFNHVLVVPDCNAFCAPRPRLGVFGWNQNYLILGLPLMDGLSHEELTAVLAHECAHLSRRHHRSGQWVYRLRRSWQQVFESMSRAGGRGRISISPLTRKFVAWFWPRFNAHAFVLSRTHEYQADAVAAELTRPAHIATALVRIGWYGRVLDEKFWPDLWQLTSSTPTPPEDVFLRVRESLGSINHQSEAKWLEKAFRSTTTNADTHPCLTDRLRAIGWPLNPDHPESLAALAPPQPTAAEFFFGAALPKIRADVEKIWRTDREADWRKQHAKAGRLNERLHQLEAIGQTVKPGDVDVLWEKARALMDLQQRETVVPLLREIVARDPKHVAANFNLGSFLLHLDDAEGETYLERAVAENEELLPQAADSLHRYYQRTGQAERIKKIYARLDLHEKSIAASRIERNNISAADNFLPPDLSETELATLRQTLAAQPEVVIAHLGRKELKYFARQKLYLLCIGLRRPWYRLANADRESFAVNQLIKSARLPGRVLIFTATGSLRPVARKLRTLPAAKIFPKD